MHAGCLGWLADRVLHAPGGRRPKKNVGGIYDAAVRLGCQYGIGHPAVISAGIAHQEYHSKCLQLICRHLGQDPGDVPETLGLSWLDDLFSMHKELSDDEEFDEDDFDGEMNLDIEVIHGI